MMDSGTLDLGGSQKSRIKKPRLDPQARPVRVMDWKVNETEKRATKSRPDSSPGRPSLPDASVVFYAPPSVANCAWPRYDQTASRRPFEARQPNDDRSINQSGLEFLVNEGRAESKKKRENWRRPWRIKARTRRESRRERAGYKGKNARKSKKITQRESRK